MFEIEETAELFLAIEDYQCEEQNIVDDGMNIIASHSNSNDKVLLHLVTEPESKSGLININDINKVNETFKCGDFNKVIFIGKKFTAAARFELKQKGIQIISEKSLPFFEPQEIYHRIREYIDKLCLDKCGKILKTESDCDGYSNHCYSCDVRQIRDDSSFHFKHGWNRLLQHDIKRLLELSANNDQIRILRSDS